MHDFRRLEVWQRSRVLAVTVSRLVHDFPRADRGVIASQLRRAILSIPANIAEGCGKSSRKETIRFFQIASGSALEAESHLLIASDLGYLSPDLAKEVTADLRVIQRMLTSLMTKLPG